jgi:nicotinamide phosphoribosyltransferase
MKTLTRKTTKKMKTNPTYKVGDKVKLICGDRDYVMYGGGPYTIRKIKKEGKGLSYELLSTCDSWWEEPENFIPWVEAEPEGRSPAVGRYDNYDTSATTPSVVKLGVNMLNNTPLKTDSYKINHWNQYPWGTQFVYSYFESRKGAKYPVTIPFGLQAILLKHFVGVRVTKEMIDQAEMLMEKHFGNKKYFNREGWEYILNTYGGKLPLRIRAVPEGTPVPTGNVLMTVENTDAKCFWLTNWAETLLTHVWYPSTVASLSRSVKNDIRHYMEKSCDDLTWLNFKLHDFGYRGTECDESAQIGGAAHLINFEGTDTIAAMVFAMYYYNANANTIGKSVAATEHSIMTSRGPGEGEEIVVEDLLNEYSDPEQFIVLSCVADSFDIENFVENIIGKKFKARILERNGIFVVRPDSVRDANDTPEKQMVWILESLWKSFGGTINKKGFKLLDPHVKALWGDGIDALGISKICDAVVNAGFSIDCLATFGMGGGLLQKVNRDTQRFAFKSSAQCRNNQWIDIYKEPRDKSKASKRGKLKLIRTTGSHGSTYATVPLSAEGDDILETVFENGNLVKFITFDEVRANSNVRTLEETIV